ncbi:hypothetical protein [Cytobacillus purgationiresistens]|uniref:hypothetical protein n=1 Tax=Cytobacillus purgationiresistens TaxID=863449 RepID=UPI003522E10F
MSKYKILGGLLGFSLEQIEEAYYQKNTVNYHRHLMRGTDSSKQIRQQEAAYGQIYL